MTATIMEGSEKGFSVYRVTATDCDYDPQNRNLTYSINGTDKGKHNITYYNIYIYMGHGETRNAIIYYNRHEVRHEIQYYNR